jgi:phosphatidylinositol-3,4,5-trisphosphate 3-phosphatase/dual-specificity protein phosphatase PTEN
LSPEDYWFSAPKKGVMVFALPGEPGLTELAGDFKIHFHDRQGDFYCWLNTTMMETRKIINTSDIDGFDKRKLPSPGFQVEVVLADFNAPLTALRVPEAETATQKMDEGINTVNTNANTANQNKESRRNDEDNVFSDGKGEDSGSSKSRQVLTAETVTPSTPGTQSNPNVASLTEATQQVIIGDTKTHATTTETKSDSGRADIGGLESSNVESEFKAMAADASVFSFGDDEDYESE